MWLVIARQVSGSGQKFAQVIPFIFRVMRRATAVIVTLVTVLCLLPATASAAAPGIAYSTPSPIRNKEATLRFSIDPGGLETSYEVEITRLGQSLKSQGMPTLVPAGEDPTAPTVGVPRYFEGGLIPGTEYHWRVTAWNDDGKTVGGEQFFTTTDGPTPVFATVIGSQTGPDQVSFTGMVDPEGVPLTDCRFRWVTKSVYVNAGFEKWAAVEMARFGETVPCGESVSEIGSGTEPVSVSGLANGLEPGEYVFRVEGENAFGVLVSGKGAPFTVAASFDAASASGSGSPDSTLSLPALPIGSPHKLCLRTHKAKKPLQSKAKNGKKRRTHQKSSKRGKACGRR